MRSIGSVLFFFLLLPILLSFIGIFTSMVFSFLELFLVVYGIGGGIAGFYYAKNNRNEGTSRKQYFFVYLPLFITVLSATILMLLTKGYFGHFLWIIFIFLMVPFFPNTIFAGLMGEFLTIFLVPFLYYGLFLIGFIISERKSIHKATFKKKSLSLASAAILLCLTISIFVMWQRAQTVLPSYGFEYENGYSSVDLEPYYVTNQNNILPKLEEPSTFTIEEKNDMPILDGAEAAYPVYAAFANAVYRDIGKVNAQSDYPVTVSFTNTIYAFERLISGEVDIFFGAQPSVAQQKLAKQAGKEIVLTPIGNEAFVFFVNEKNEVNDLSTEQIKKIYSGKITQWDKVGGKSDKIRAFQRPEDSGSQTIMEKIMGDTPLMDPLKEELISGMGGIMEQVADYRNYKNALGYSFRFFATGMNPTDDLKLLSINGIEPNPENIRNESYPYTVNLYAITVKDNQKKTIKPFLEWMKGPQGQKLVEEVGYISTK
ncbi:substrate-binding domain-containing protein [Ferdinandcohnia quinoae]|uniref:Substrate-binding domain-containing protein n=1 Tax=Fredinandcohnia quinoae TaxID=2918902 RepID=A0AAW5ECT9_9BACI|nr:substrate-binding domain-containing protein [Fredinandcohnia sp. SECRCQ15]MCH1627266.1 substrate-binding domain-containing protein [Fredinandcohnia sp. SECRCQ15]